MIVVGCHPQRVPRGGLCRGVWCEAVLSLFVSVTQAGPCPHWSMHHWPRFYMWQLHCPLAESLLPWKSTGWPQWRGQAPLIFITHGPTTQLHNHFMIVLLSDAKILRWMTVHLQWILHSLIAGIFVPHLTQSQFIRFPYEVCGHCTKAGTAYRDMCALYMHQTIGTLLTWIFLGIFLFCQWQIIWIKFQSALIVSFHCMTQDNFDILFCLKKEIPKLSLVLAFLPKSTRCCFISCTFIFQARCTQCCAVKGHQPHHFYRPCPSDTHR